jgi:hypothetical protein
MMDDNHEQNRKAYRALRDFLKRAGWPAGRIASAMGVSESTAVAYGARPTTLQYRVIPEERLLRLRQGAMGEAERYLVEVRSYLDLEWSDAA